MLAKRIGENIKRARKSAGISLEKLAAKIEPPTSYQHLSRLEQGHRSLSIEWIEKIAKALEVDPLLLLTGEAEARPGAAFRLGEQDATEAARTLTVVVTGDQEPDAGIVQVAALALQELLASFSALPQSGRDPQVSRVVGDLVARRFAPLAN